MAQVFSADSIIGKTLIAAKPVSITRFASDTAPVVFTVSPGQPVGVVDSYLKPGTGRSRLWWQFRDNTGRFYYSEQVTGNYSLTALKDQGVLTTKEETEKAEAENKPFSLPDFIQKNIYLVVIAAAIVALAKQPLSNLLKK